MGTIEQPPRPSISSIFVFGLALWIGCAVSLSTARSNDIAILPADLLCAIATLAICTYAFKAKRANTLIVLVLGALLGAALGLTSSYALKNSSESILAADISRGTIELEEDAKASSFGSTSTGTLTLENGRRLKVGIQFGSSSDGLPRYGDVIDARFEVKDPGFAASERWWNKGCATCLNVRSFEKATPEVYGALLPTSAILTVRNNAITSFSSSFDENASTRAFPLPLDSLCDGLFSNDELSQTLGAIACGYKSDLSNSALYGSFKKCGLAHMMAVSGAHLVIVVALFNSLAKFLSLGRKTVIAIDVAVMFAYLLLAGFPVSALRATLMTATSITSSLSKRRPSSLNALGICAVAIVAHDPFASLSVSFMLSFASTFGIVVFSPYVTHLLRSTFSKLPDFFAETVSLTVSSNMVCLPISCSLFSQLPLITVIANLACGLIFPFFCAAALLCGVSFTIVPFASNLLFTVAAAIGSAFCAIACLLAKAPFSCIPVYLPEPIGYALTFLIPIAFWIAWPKANTRTVVGAAAALLSAALVLVLVVPGAEGTRVVMLDVGQGDAFLIQSESQTLLIDTGNHDSMLIEALGRNHVSKLDAVLITHSDSDHAGSLDALSNSITIDSVLLAQSAFTCKDEACRSIVRTSQKITPNVLGLAPGDTIKLGSFEIDIVWPYSFDDAWKNENSLCAVATADVNRDDIVDCKALFTGDAEIGQLETIVESNAVHDIDILKVAHHGSDTGTNAAIVEELNPKIALISVGESNRYGHPKQSVVNVLEDCGSNVFRTDTSGDVSCKITAGCINVSTQR